MDPTSTTNNKLNKWRLYKHGRGGRRGDATGRNQRGSVIGPITQDILSNAVETNSIEASANFSTPSRHNKDDTSVCVKVISDTSTTPMPQFDSMNEAELNLRLGEFGMRPVGRARAIRMLKRIYEAVHPVTDPGAGTPIAQRVSRSLIRTQKRPVAAARAEKTREKRIRKAISKFVVPTSANQATDTQPCLASGYVTGPRNYNIDEMNAAISLYVADTNEVAPSTSMTEQFSVKLTAQSTGISASSTNILAPSVTANPSFSCIENVTDHLPQRGDIAYLLRTFLDWLRLPENKDLYYELLTLNPVLQERLVSDFGEQLRVQKISRAKFAEMLDHIHITYCVPQHDNGHY